MRIAKEKSSVDTSKLDTTGHRTNIKEEVLAIPRKAFYGCASLREVYLPKQIRILEDECFSGCCPDFVLHHEGDGFWFLGQNALPKIKRKYYWGKIVRHVKGGKKEELTLSALLERESVSRARYIETDLKYQDYDLSPSEIINVAKGGRLPRRSTFDSFGYDDYDYDMPRTYEDAYEIYGSRLWDA